MTAPRQDLPFEYSQRWTELRDGVGGPDGGTIDVGMAAFLEQRDRDLEDFLATLPTSGGGITQAFAADSAGTSTTLIASGGSSSAIQFRVSSTSISRFRTDEVSDLSAASTSVTLPTGLWTLTALIQITVPSTRPASGYVDVMFDFINEWVRVPWDQIVEPGVGNELASVWLHRLYYFSTAPTIGFTVDNFTDQSIRAQCKMFFGVQMAAHGDLALA